MSIERSARGVRQPQSDGKRSDRVWFSELTFCYSTVFVLFVIAVIALGIDAAWDRDKRENNRREDRELNLREERELNLREDRAVSHSEESEPEKPYHCRFLPYSCEE